MKVDATPWGTPWAAGCNCNEINKLLFNNLWKTGSEIIVNENPAVSLPWGSLFKYIESIHHYLLIKVTFYHSLKTPIKHIVVATIQ